MKRGQVTLFIVLALVILAIIGVISYYYANLTELDIGDITLPQEVRNYKETLNDCLGTITEEAVILISLQGGYFNLPDENFEDIIAYYYIKGQSTIPTLRQMGSELSNYVRTYMDSCIMQDNQYDIKTNEKQITTNILQDSVNFKINYDFALTFNEKEYKIKDEYSNEYQLPMGKMYNIASSIIQEQLQDKDNICYSCILSLAAENNVKIKINSFENSLLFTIIDKDYTFAFANQY